MIYVRGMNSSIFKTTEVYNKFQCCVRTMNVRITRVMKAVLFIFNLCRVYQEFRLNISKGCEIIIFGSL